MKLSPAARRAILYAWPAGEKSMAELAQDYGVTPQAIDYHLRNLGAMRRPAGRRKRRHGCCEPGCSRPHKAHGRCRSHYERWCWAERPEVRAAMAARLERWQRKRRVTR